MTEIPKCFYRVTVKGLVVKNDKILLNKESPELGGRWELPGGGLDFGEHTHEGLKREIEEEMGVRVKAIDERPTYIWTWRYENKRGLEWFYSLVIAYRMELESLDLKVTNECVEAKFFSKEELREIELNGQTSKLATIFNPKDFE